MRIGPVSPGARSNWSNKRCDAVAFIPVHNLARRPIDRLASADIVCTFSLGPFATFVFSFTVSRCYFARHTKTF